MKEIWIKVKHDTCEDYIHAYQTDVTILGIEDEDFEDLYGMPEEEYMDDIMYDVFYPTVNTDGEFYMRETDGGCIMCDKLCEEMDRMEFINTVLGFVYCEMPDKWEVIEVKE